MKGGIMITEEVRKRLRKKLIERRAELLDFRDKIKGSFEDLGERAIEKEEEALKLGLTTGLDVLEDRQIGEIKAIDRAIGKIETGLYGSCEFCGEEISEKRLELIPWAELCIRCAEKAESPGGLPSPEVERPVRPILTPGLSGLSDRELLEGIFDTLRTDGRIDDDELEIECREGKVRLTGVLPSEAQRALLLSILQDTLGVKDVAAELRIDPVPWERRSRATGDGGAENRREDGEPVTPPDRLVPEREI
jgi:RNA polymerase-binding transcription factor DksA